MKRFRKVTNCLTWTAIALSALLLLVFWSRIPSSVVTHFNFHSFSFGPKSTLIILLIIEIVANALLTFGYDVTFIREIRKINNSPRLIDVLTVILQILAVGVISAFIIAGIVLALY
ncbi:MAG TPA: hypothetical protein H9955_09935 [Candidatus Mediterraneibacter cottocaccae]|nr:hypothetical protein [Candidatus Mediterraneibacter cottocaccae]